MQRLIQRLLQGFDLALQPENMLFLLGNQLLFFFSS